MNVQTLCGQCSFKCSFHLRLAFLDLVRAKSIPFELHLVYARLLCECVMPDFFSRRKSRYFFEKLFYGLKSKISSIHIIVHIDHYQSLSPLRKFQNEKGSYCSTSSKLQKLNSAFKPDLHLSHIARKNPYWI